MREKTNIPQVLARLGSAALTLGGSELARAGAIAKRDREQEKLRQLGSVLSGASVPAYARVGGAEGFTPEEVRRNQNVQLGALGTPEALNILTARTEGTGSADQPSAVKEYQFFNQLNPQQQQQYINVKRADPLRAKGLLESASGIVQQQPGFAESVRGIEEARETGAQQARTEFEPVREAEKTKQVSKARFQQEFVNKMPVAYRAAQSANSAMQNTINSIDNILPNVNNFTAGFASIADFVPGTPAADLAKQLDQVKAFTAFDALQEMRDNSPTGGALGGIAVAELELLQSAFTNVTNSQSPEQLSKNLIKLRKRLKQRIKKTNRNIQLDVNRAGIDISEIIGEPPEESNLTEVITPKVESEVSKPVSEFSNEELLQIIGAQ